MFSLIVFFPVCVFGKKKEWQFVDYQSETDRIGDQIFESETDGEHDDAVHIVMHFETADIRTCHRMGIQPNTSDCDCCEYDSKKESAEYNIIEFTSRLYAADASASNSC